MLHRTFTNRFEVKYLVSQKKALDLRDALGDLFVTDENTQGQSGYFNYSIYFDSPRYYFYRQKLEGQLERVKPRLRAHLPSLAAKPDQWFLELKGRHGQTVQKRRAAIDLISAQGLVDGENFVADGELEALRDFEFMWLRLALRPAVTVLYFREPLNSHIFPNVRITFDHRISGNLDFNLKNAGQRMDFITSPSEVLVELKFTDSIPRLVMEIFRRLEMKQITFSKYALCLESCIDKLPETAGFQRKAMRVPKY
ncbi:polyphosphate polymerase domain-containing protein [Thalassospira sp. HF15]|uniref:polyphosphate polymerase domain-containing protein n=1 Tax=Thalassospira sp. HF15 TaxID=2722755 RepID=UPI0014308EAC|nr:polyphosphate polymerase domain-containing protein [Thalassospira sp. HF15]NIY75179.1 polyphosphate polymerase domain-containing protein [Thalassospira sp. HF15]